MSLPSLSSVDVANLSPELLRELFALAADAGGPSFDPAQLERRLARYPTVLVARDARGLAAFSFVDVKSRGAHLVYLGPLFSRRGAYVSLFAAYLEQWLDGAERFCLGIEIANPLVRDVLALVLPTTAQPRRGEEPSETLRSLARVFAVEFRHHVRGLDARSLTMLTDETPSERRDASRPCQLVLVPCLDDSHESIRAELKRGLEALALLRGGNGFVDARSDATPSRRVLAASPPST